MRRYKSGERKLNERIHLRRTAIGKTLDEIGRIVGVSRATVQRWETGTIKEMRRDKLVALSRALQTTPDYLMGLTDDPAPSATRLSTMGVQFDRSNTVNEIFHVLLHYAGFSTSIDKDKNWTVYKNGVSVDMSHEKVSHIMEQTLQYFAYLIERNQ